MNVVSDELNKPIVAIDAALKTLNLGVTTWVEFAGSVDHNAGCFWARSLGYAKISGKWGIAIRTMAGDFGDEPSEEYWPFSDAPRAYRLEAADKLPDLIEKLVTAADETAEKLKQKIDATNQVAQAIAQSPVSVKEAFLAEVRKAKVVFFNTVARQAQSIEFKNDHLILRFADAQGKLVEIAEQNRAWLEELAQRVGGRKITLSIDVIAQPRK